MKLAIVLATLPVVAAAALSMPAQDSQGVGESEPLPGRVAPASMPSLAPVASPAKGEIAVALVNKSGEIVDHDWFNVTRLDDGRAFQSSIAAKRENQQFLFTDLDAGRYEVEAKNFATGYVDVLQGERASITLSVADWNPTVASGRVVRGESGVADAEIWAQLYSWPQPRYANVETDAAGYFSLSLPTTGEWSFYVSPPGWETTERSWNIVLGHSFAAQVLPEGVTDLRFEIPTGRISGLVKDSSGKPVPGHIVSLDGKFDWRGISETRTDEAGRFAFHDMGPGSYLASCGGALPWQAHSAVADSPIACRRVELAQSDARIEDVELKLVPSGELELETVAPDGAAPTGVWVFARPSQAPQGYWSMISGTREDGFVGAGANRFVGRLPVGPLTLSLGAPGANLSMPIDTMVKIASGTRAKARVQLVAATTVTIRAVDAASVPVFFRVVEVRAANGLELFLDGPESDSILPLIRLRPLPPGEYVLTIADPAGRTYEQTIKLDGEPERDVLFQL